MITVTKPFLPPFEEYSRYLSEIWQRNWLTNNGPCVQQLEEQLKNFLHVNHLIYVNNGTIALQIALKAMGATGEVITTPFSYVATTNSLLWEGCKPVFADIKNTDCNIDPEKIIPLISKKTTAILATHVYGNPCDTYAIEKIGKDHGLKVLYDGAHAFGTMYKNKPLLSYGDISTCSFHATKLFHTVEGGAIITNDDELSKKMILYRQFGHIGDEYFSIGINGKSSELHAAMGLCLLPRLNEFIEKRKSIAASYDKFLKDLPLQRPVAMDGTEYNFSYYPVITDSEERVLCIQALLQKNDIGTRRYFYPSLNHLPQYHGEDCPVSESISPRVLALPVYHELAVDDVERIADLIKTCF